MTPTPDRPSSDQTATRATSAPPRGDEPTEPTALGEFVVIRKIGEGGMGAVYLAEDRKLGRKAAIKTMKRELAADPTNRARFAREARAAAAVESDYIVPIWQIGEAADGTPFIAMPFLQGEMLDERLKRAGSVPVGLVLKVALEVGHGLAAAHAKGLIHRDIKPGNIWLEGEPGAPESARQVRRCKILDFGLARSVGAEDANVTASGAILGTPAYMAPEQARGERVDFRADLWSLGVTLYRMATGRAPFHGPNAMAVLIALATDTPEPVARLAPHLPPGLSALIDRLMSKDPAQRPASAAEVAAEVKRIARDLQAQKAAPVVVRLPDAPPATDPFGELTEPHVEPPPLAPLAKARFPIALVGAALVALVALVAGGAWFATRDGAKPEPEAAKSEPPAPKPPDPKPKGGPKQPAPERRAAEWVIGLGGKVEVVSGQTVATVAAVADLPAGPFRVNRVDLLGSTAVRGQSFAPLRDCPTVAHLFTPEVDLTDEQLAPLAGWTALEGVMLISPHLTDRALETFKNCKRLTYLNVQVPRISDTGLAHLAGCEPELLWLPNSKITEKGLSLLKLGPKLRSLNLYGVPLDDATAGLFRKCTGVTELFIGGTQLTDTGLAALVGPQLATAELHHTRITDAGLWRMRAARLKELRLDGTNVTDAGVTALKAQTGLKVLKIKRTGITSAGVKELANALPKCTIEWDGGTIKP